MLLNTASVDSLEGGVLTVAFAGEGQAKGFAASGHDQVLIGVLATMLGLKVRVRAAVGTVSGSHGSRPAPADPASRADTSGRAAAPSADRPAERRVRPSGAGPGSVPRQPARRHGRPAGRTVARPDGSAGQRGDAACQVPGSVRWPGRHVRGRWWCRRPGVLVAAAARASVGRPGPPRRARPPRTRRRNGRTMPGLPPAGPARPAWNSSSGDSAARSSRRSKSPSCGRPQGRRAARRTAVTDGSPVCVIVPRKRAGDVVRETIIVAGGTALPSSARTLTARTGSGFLSEN